ncbi:MAG: DUF1849 family protein [Proteobacteria bacterium]|nr:DUF1849 family protein [Pseudomonadota bacterium]
MQIFSQYKRAIVVLAVVIGVTHPDNVVVALQPSLAGAAPVNIATHRALYDFDLAYADLGIGLNGVKGQMYFEQDDTCDAWTTDRRFTTQYQYADRTPDEDSSHYTSFESKDQKQFSFSSERHENGEMVELLRGSVEKNVSDGTARAVYSRPGNISYDLPKGYLLPTLHSIEVIRQARAGRKFFNAVLFDGTDADGPVEINVFIGKKVTAAEIQKIAKGNKTIDARLLTPDAWHIRMAVFPLKNREDMLSAYEMEMIMHDNGVVSDALVDYKTFRVEQKLTALERLPPRKCP